MTATAITERIGVAKSSSGPRIGQLDALRGFALAGISVINIYQITGMRGIVDLQKLPIPHVLDMTAHQRFFPLFSLLFGIAFGIFLQRVQAKAQRPRLLLLPPGRARRTRGRTPVSAAR